MKLQLLSPAKALSKAYLRQSLKRDQIATEIDRLVYALYGLTEEEIAMVEGK